MTHTNKTLGIVLLFIICVPTGTANDYNYALRISPAVLFLTSIDIELDKKIVKNITIGPMLTYFNYAAEGDRLKMTGIGARINYHFNEVFVDSFVISSFIKHWRYDITNNAILGGTFTGQESATKLGFVAGYQWQWQRINMNLGALYAFSGLDQITLTNNNGKSRTYTRDDSFFISNIFLEWNLGIVF